MFIPEIVDENKPEGNALLEYTGVAGTAGISIDT